MTDLPLKPWEKFVTGMDLGREDQSCVVYGVYDGLTGKLRITDVEILPDSPASSVRDSSGRNIEVPK